MRTIDDDSRLWDVVIVGAGPAGAATAARLAPQHHVLLVEKTTFPREKLCGDYINPAGVEILRRLGILRDALKTGQSLGGMAIGSPKGRMIMARFPDGFGLALPRATLDLLLIEHAKAQHAAVAEGITVTDLIRDTDRWLIRTNRGIIQCRVVVGADGMRSVVARTLGRQTPPLHPGRYAVGAYFSGVRGFAGHGEMHLGGDLYCGVASFADGRTNVTMTLPKHTIRSWRGDMDGRFHAALEGFPALAPRIRGAERVSDFRAVGPLAQFRGPAVADGAALVGDAAAFLDPLTGQGVSLALASGMRAADVISQALVTGDLTVRSLQEYETWRRHSFGAMHWFSRVAAAVARHPNLIELVTRAWGHRPLLASQFLGVIGNQHPLSRVVHPAYLLRLLSHAH